MGGIAIITGGLFTTVQDLGRPSGTISGFPWGGVMDRKSAIYANSLVGNSSLSALLEITLVGPKILFLEEVKIAICGAYLSPSVNGERINNNTVVTVKKEDVLSFGKLKSGCRAYLAISGGIKVPLILGSASTYTYANIGGYKGRHLSKGDHLELLKPADPYLKKPEELTPTEVTSQPCLIPCLEGPEYHLFSKALINQFKETIFKIGNSSNRMGYRLELEHPLSHGLPELISSGTVRGTIQLPRSGKPIVLMADSPTTGGYPRIANCTENGTDLLAQCKPGDTVIFYIKK